jgi:hypothetical protein
MEFEKILQLFFGLDRFGAEKLLKKLDDRREGSISLNSVVLSYIRDNIEQLFKESFGFESIDEARNIIEDLRLLGVKKERLIQWIYIRKRFGTQINLHRIKQWLKLGINERFIIDYYENAILFELDPHNIGEMLDLGFEHEEILEWLRLGITSLEFLFLWKDGFAQRFVRYLKLGGIEKPQSIIENIEYKLLQRSEEINRYRLYSNLNKPPSLGDNGRMRTKDKEQNWIAERIKNEKKTDKDLFFSNIYRD